MASFTVRACGTCGECYNLAGGSLAVRGLILLVGTAIAAVSFAGLLAVGEVAARWQDWPDGVDATALVLFAGVAFGLPLVGYGLMALDIRAYWRSLRRALVVVARVVTPGTPYWAVRGDRPPCLVALELVLPCTEEQVLGAYRRRVKELHPDRGGDLRQFLRLQTHFEQAMHLARSEAVRGGARG